MAIYGLLAFFSYLMWMITIQYIPVNLNAAFLKTKQVEVQETHYQVAFFIHVYTSMLALLAGLTQFSNYLRSRQVHIHRWVGKIYVAIVLFASGPTGLVMGFYANGGIISQISFCLLATLWIFCTAQAFKAIRLGKINAHREWMYRSYALTLSAITLRLWKWLIVLLFDTRPMDTYRIVAWLGWVLNLAIAEWLIYRWRLGRAMVNN